MRRPRQPSSLADLEETQGQFGRKLLGIRPGFCRKFVVSPTGCWEWQRGFTKSGYGELRVNRRNVKAHRLSWILHCGTIPTGLQVCHHCDNKRCVNPAHLFVGTGGDNARDARDKGIAYVARAKLTEVKVMAMRQRRVNGGSYGEIAKEFQVNRNSVPGIIKGRAWSHLPGLAVLIRK